MAETPEERIRRYLDEQGGRAEVSARDLLTTWGAERFDVETRERIGAALEHAGIRAEPDLGTLGEDHSVVLTTGGAAPAAAQPPPGGGGGGLRRFVEGDRFDVVLAVLLGLAAVATAFAAYKAELRDGDSIKAFNEGIRATDKASQQTTEGNQQFAQDQAQFLEYAKAAQQDDTELVAYLRTSLMSEELVAGIEWWENDKGDANTPFVDENPKYAIAAYGEAERLDKQAGQRFEEAVDKDDEGDRYTLITVILATALFLYGIASVARVTTVKLGTAAAGAAIFLIALVLLVAG